MPPIPRGIDHVVVAVHDLQAARARYQALGFTLTPRADHPFGTSNSLVQFEGNFLELLAVTDPARLPPGGPGEFSFGQFNATALRRREGMTMLVFESHDARRDLAEFQAAGLTHHGPLDFERKAGLPDGREVTVAFSLAFVTEPRMPDAAFFVCQQHAPEHFWKPEYQRHANTARQIAEVWMLAAEPARWGDLFGKLQRPAQVHAQGEELRVATARGQVTVLTPRRLAERFPGLDQAAQDGASPRFMGLRLATRDVGAAAATLAAASLPHEREGKRAWVQPSQAHGLLIEWSEG